jgi:predicted transglutaminase-like cysteine proteinase
MNNMIRAVSGVVLMALVSASSSAGAFGLGEMTKPLGRSIQNAFIKSKSRTAAPFAHVIFCQSLPDECATQGGADTVQLDRDKRNELRRVNRMINRQIVAVNETPAYRGADEWSLAPAEGDCEDFAITKRHNLIKMGWPAAALRLAIARTSWGEGHLVLVVRTNGGDLVLDNLTNSVRSWNKTGLTWEMIQSSDNPKNWYRI